MHGVDDAHAAEEIDLSGKTFHVPHQHAGIELYGDEQHHDDLVNHALQRIELAIDADLKRIGIALEDAVAVIINLPEAADEMLPRAQFRMISPDPIGKDIEEEPYEKIGDQDEADEIVHSDRRPERHHIDQPDIADLHAGENHQEETDGIGPVPESNRQRVDVESLHVAVPFSAPAPSCRLGTITAGWPAAVTAGMRLA